MIDVGDAGIDSTAHPSIVRAYDDSLYRTRSPSTMQREKKDAIAINYVDGGMGAVGLFTIA